MSILDNRYDLGDVVGSILMYTSIVAWTGIGSPNIYGYSLVDPAFTVSEWAVPMYTLGMGTAVAVAFLTNGNLTWSGLKRRPGWEKIAVAGTIAFPAVVDNVQLLEDTMLSGHIWGSMFGLLALSGYVIVAFRRDRDKKASLTEAARALAAQG